MTSVEPTQDTEPDAGRLRTMYEEAARELATERAKTATYQREGLFRDAGLDLSNPLHATIAKAYDGDPEPDKVKEFIGTLGLTQSDPTPPPAFTAEERAAEERIAHMAAGDGTPPPEPDRIKQLEDELRDAAMHQAPQSTMEDIGRRLSKAKGFPVVGPDDQVY